MTGTEATIVTAISSALGGAGVAWGLMQGSFREFKNTTERRLNEHKELIDDRQQISVCDRERDGCRAEILHSLTRLEKSTELIIRTLINRPHNQRSQDDNGNGD